MPQLDLHTMLRLGQGLRAYFEPVLIEDYTPEINEQLDKLENDNEEN